MNLGGLDWNLMLTLQALLEERNVTRAGEKVRLSQPATSAALAKLRRHFDDELLLRIGRDYQLTPLAQVLLPLVAEAVVHVERALEVRPTFDALHSDIRFTVASSDYVAAVLMSPMRELLQVEAPGLSVEFIPLPDRLVVDQLLKYDLLIGPLGFGLAASHDLLFEDRFVCIVDAKNPKLSGSPEVMTLLRELPHAVGRFGTGINTPADRLLEEMDVRRQVAAGVAGLVALPLFILNTDLIALVPWLLAQRFIPEVVVMEVPGSERALLTEAVYWHPSRTADPALQWLRTLLIRASAGLQS